MAKSWEDIIAERKKQVHDPYGGDDKAKSRNISIIDEPWQDVLAKRGADPYQYMDDYEKKSYNRPYYDFTKNQEQNQAKQKLYDTMVKPAAPINQKEVFTGYKPKVPKPNRPQENATLTNIPNINQIKDTFKTQPIKREPVAQDTASLLKMNPTQRMKEFEYQTGAARPEVDMENPAASLKKYPYAPYNQGTIQQTPKMVQDGINLKRGFKDKTKAFLHGLVNPIAKPIQRFFDDGMKDENGLYPNDGSKYKSTHNWYIENEQKLLQKGYSAKDIKQMRKQDLKAAQQEDERLQFNAAMDKRRDYQPTTGDEIAKMGGEMTTTLAQALAMGAGINAAGVTGIAGAALTGAGTEAVSSYSERDDLLTAAKDIARNALFFGAGRYGSDKVGAVAGELITKYGLDTNIAVLYATEAVKGLAFDATGYAATLPTYPLTGDDMPTGKEVAMDMLVGALFDFIPNAFDVRGTYEANLNAEKMQKVVREIKYNYDAAAEYERSSRGDVETLDKMYDGILNDIAYIRESINSKPIAGQEQTIEMLNELFRRTEDHIMYKRMPRELNKEAYDNMQIDNMHHKGEGPQRTEVPQIKQEPVISKIEPELKQEYPSVEEITQNVKQQHNNIIEEYNKQQRPEPQPPIPKPDRSELPTEYGRNGKKAYTKWGNNKYVNADLNNVNDPYTQDYKKFFETFYEAGRLGVPKNMVQYEGSNNFPPFLEDAFYAAGKNDMAKNSPKNGTNIPEPKTQDPLPPITTPLKTEEAAVTTKDRHGYDLGIDTDIYYWTNEDGKPYLPFENKAANTKGVVVGVNGDMIQVKSGDKIIEIPGKWSRVDGTMERLKQRVNKEAKDQEVNPEVKEAVTDLKERLEAQEPKAAAPIEEPKKEPTTSLTGPPTGSVEAKDNFKKGEKIYGKAYNEDGSWEEYEVTKVRKVKGDKSNGYKDFEILTLKNKDGIEYNEFTSDKFNRYRMPNGEDTPKGWERKSKEKINKVLYDQIEKDFRNGKMFYDKNRLDKFIKNQNPGGIEIRNKISSLIYEKEKEYIQSGYVFGQGVTNLDKRTVKKWFNLNYQKISNAAHKQYNVQMESLPFASYDAGDEVIYYDRKKKKRIKAQIVSVDRRGVSLDVDGRLVDVTHDDILDIGKYTDLDESLGLKVKDPLKELMGYYDDPTPEPTSMDRIEDRKEQVKKNLAAEEAQEAAPVPKKEVVEMTQEEYDILKASYDEVGRAMPEDIEVKIVEPEKETKVEREAYEKEFEKEAKKALTDRSVHVYNYIRAFRKNGKATLYKKSPELEGVDGLETLSSFLSFTTNSKNKLESLDVMQMEMAHDFPEIEELGLEEFAQYLVDNVKKYRDFIKTQKLENVNKKDLLFENELAHKDLHELEKQLREEKFNILEYNKANGHGIGYARDSYSKAKIRENTLETLKRMEHLKNAYEKNKEAEDYPDYPFDDQVVKPKKEIAPSRQLADEILKYIDSEQTFSPNKLYEMADKAFGGTQAEGKYEIKDAYDAMELAVNLWLKRDADYLVDDTKVSNAVKNLKTLETLMKRLPTQTKRSERTDSYQQFSTPPTVAYLASYAANIKETDTVLEPSAGIGGLAVFADRNGAKVVTNELEPNRLEVLKEMGFETYNVNAEQIDNLLPESVKPTVVMMNPPFSSAPERMKDKTATANAKRHIEQALERLEDGGRLIAIVGEGMADDKPTFKGWFNELRDQYDIRANLSLNKTAFNKYGTNFGTQLIVIDKKGPQVGKTLTGKYDNLTDIPKVLEGIRNDRREIEPKTIKPGSKETIADTRPNGALSTTGDGKGDTGLHDTTTKQPITRIDAEGGEIKPTDTTKGMGTHDKSTGPNNNASDTTTDTEARTPGSVSTNDREQSNGTVKAENRKTKKKIENEDDVYSVYEPSKLSLKGAKPHMSDLVESAAMAAVDPPDVSYTPQLPKKLIESGALSLAQLENIVYAGQAHSQMLPEGKRKGHFIGDGTGVGKGREIAGIIMDNMAQGRKKAVWFTMNQSLVTDAYRDWTELGNSKESMYQHSKVKAGEPINIKEGVLVSTYGMLKSGAKNNPKATRLNQLVEWLGKDFDGVIVFDEAHNMANAIDSGEGLSKKKASQTALAGIELQNLLPNARIEYVSATGATDVHNLAYLTRLGLWGKGTAFKNVNDFISSVGSGGLAAMELVARDMKAMGVYLARSISFKGVEYDTLEHNLSPMQTEIYDTMSEAWSIVMDNVEDALKFTGGNKNSNAQRAAKSQFYNSIQSFYNQMITAMSMPSVINDIKKELDKGNSCVIQIVNTNEAAAERQFEKMAGQNLELDELDLTPRDTLIQYLNNSFPVHEFEDYTDDNGNVRSRPVVDAAGNPVVSKKAVKKRDELISMVEQMSVPDGPLEMLLDAFGPDMVAEVTGRKRRVVTTKDKDGNSVRKIEKRNKNSGLADAESFQGMKKRILVFSDAGGTGKSYHADRRAKNQQHRIHYLLQPGWNVFKATQGLGRTHRTNQVSAPTFRLVTTNVMGQKRFTSTIARRLDQLGALTKGQRQAGSGMFGEKDNLESPLAKDALAVFYKELYRVKGKGVFRKLGLEKKMLNEYGAFSPDKAAERDTSLFLNRILALKVSEQNEVFGLYMDIFDKVFNKAVEDGTLDMGLENVKADKITLDQEAVIREQDGVKTKYVQMTVYKKPKLVEYKSLKKLLKNYKGLATDTRTGEIKAIYQVNTKTNEKGEVVNQYVVQGPMRDKRSILVENTINEHFAMLPEDQWKTAWDEETTKQPEYLDEKLHMLTGTLLPIWDRLPQSNTSVKRVMTDAGESYLGRVISAKEIDGVLRNFSLEAKKESYTREQLVDMVLNKDKILVLSGGDKLKVERKRVSNEWRMEITGRNLFYYTRNYPGMIHEKIAYKDRYFIPTGAKGLEIMEALTKEHPVLEVKNRVINDNDEVNAFTSVEGQPHKELGAATGKNTDIEGTKSATQIFKAFEKAYNVAVKSRPRRGTLGTYHNREHLIRIKKTNDIPVLCHETGHLIDKIHGFSEDHKAPYAKELETLGENTSRKSYSPNKKRREGVAEFVRLYLTNTEEAEKLNFYTDFVNALSEKELKTINDLQKDIWKLSNLAPEERVGKTIQFYDGKKDKESFDFEKFTRSIVTNIFNENYPVEWAAGQMGGKEAQEQMKNRLGIFRGHEGIALFDIDPHGEGSYQTNLKGEKVGKSYNAILSPVHKSKKVREDFMKYQVARRGLDYYKRELEFPESKATCEETIRTLENKYPEFKEVFKELLQYRHNNLKLLVEAGLMTEDSYKRTLEENPNYVPLKRDVENYQYATGDSKKIGGSKNVVKKLKGGGQDIIDPEINDINNTFAYRSAAMRNEILIKLANLAESSEGVGYIMSKTQMKMKMFELSQEQINNIVKQGLAQLGITSDDMDFDVLNRVFKPNYAAGPNQVIVYRNGKPELYDIHPELYETISGLSTRQANVIIDTLGKISNIAKTGIIFTPQYLYRNFARDTFQNLIGSESGVNILDILGGFFSAMTKDEHYKMYQKHGGTINFFSANDRKFLNETVDQISRSQKKAAKVGYKLRHPLNTIQDMIEPLEAAGRIAEMKKLLKKHGNSEEAINKAIESGRDLSVDFKQTGALIKKLQLNRIINFFNAQIQGMGKDFRLLTNKRTALRTIVRALAYLTAPTLALWFMNKDNENYQELPSYRKDFFFNIPIGDSKNTSLFFMIPKPFGLGTLFAALPERLAEKAYRDNPRAFDGFWESLEQAWGVPFMPSALNPLYEVDRNRDWRDIPILNQGDQNLPPHLQYNQYTSEAAKSIANMTKNIPGMPTMLQSPKQIDHLIKGYTGTLGSMGLGAIDAATGKRDRNPLKTIGTGFIVDSSRRPESIDKYYEYKEKLDYEYMEWKVTGTAPDGFKPHVRELFKRINSELIQLRENMNKAEMLPESKEKEKMLEDLRALEINLMKGATRIYEKEYR